MVRGLIEKAESHVIIFLLFLGLRFFLLFLGGCSTSGSRGSASSGSNLGDQILEVTVLKSLGKESWPVWLEFNTSSLEDRGESVSGDRNIVISEDESSVDTCKFSRHGDGAQVS